MPVSRSPCTEVQIQTHSANFCYITIVSAVQYYSCYTILVSFRRCWVTQVNVCCERCVVKRLFCSEVISVKRKRSYGSSRIMRRFCNKLVYAWNQTFMSTDLYRTIYVCYDFYTDHFFQQTVHCAIKETSIAFVYSRLVLQILHEFEILHDFVHT